MFEPVEPRMIGPFKIQVSHIHTPYPRCRLTSPCIALHFFTLPSLVLPYLTSPYLTFFYLPPSSLHILSLLLMSSCCPILSISVHASHDQSCPAHYILLMLMMNHLFFLRIYIPSSPALRVKYLSFVMCTLSASSVS
jgi:hypothetical protein